MNSTLSPFVALVAFQTAHPELTFNNNGYQELSNEVKQRNHEAISKVAHILKDHVRDFVRFQNFCPDGEGSFKVRCQTRYSESFTGVSYIPFSSFKLEGY